MTVNPKQNHVHGDWQLGITATEGKGCFAGISTNVPTELACRASAEATWDRGQ